MAPNAAASVEGEQPVDVYDRVTLATLPSFSKLQSQVHAVVQDSSWWERHGVDWIHILTGVALLGLGLVCLSVQGSDAWPLWILGTVCLGCSYSITSNKGGHAAAHGSVGTSPWFNNFCTRLLLDFNGSFPSKLAIKAHVHEHHPHTNIIGLGDSSMWKVPILPCYVYMFVAPLFVPLMTPAVALHDIIKGREWTELVKWSVLATAGIAFYTWLLVSLCGFSVVSALAYIPVFRAVCSIPYIHFNIFQHIGLPMYSPEDRPVRIYQMSTGVLNLHRNPILDFTMGHSLISCHIEHHLFPKLSDNMCLKVRPIVRRYLLENGLPYHEDSYSNRLQIFLKNYVTLMVKAPPITHFVGLQ